MMLHRSNRTCDPGLRLTRRTLIVLILLVLSVLLAGSLPVNAMTSPSLRSSLLSQNRSEYQEPEFEDFSQLSDLFPSEKPRKSLSRAIFFSLLVPGSGEFYAGSKTRGRIFLGVEASLWTSFFGFRTYGAWAKNDYKSFSAVHAGVNLEGKSDEFFEDINFYASREEYNQLARLYQRDEVEVYPGSDFWYWYWDSPESQHRYRKLRNRSESAYRKALFVVGLAAANRVLSVIDTIREIKKYNRKIDPEFSSLSVDFDINPIGTNSGFKVTLSRSF